MDFPPHTDKIMRPFLESFGKCAKPKLDKTAAQKLDTLFISLYQDIKDAQALVLTDACFQSQQVTTKADFKRPVLHFSKYYPTQIRDYIKDNEHSQTLYQCKKIGNREINIIFTNFHQTERMTAPTDAAVRQMYVWLAICAKYAKATCAQTLDVYVYPTPFTKVLPATGGSVLSPDNVNTAFTTACAPESQIIIFREEEWFKVFIHETFHSYGLDFATNNGMTEYVASIFPIQSDFSIYEAYTETWARIINCVFSSITTPAPKEFLANLNFCLEMERMFAIYQCAKILGYMGLHYNNLHAPGSIHVNLRQNLYKENTHVFAYYVLTAIFLNDYPGFLLWCKTHNTALIKFKDTQENFQAFDAYIKQIYNCPSFQAGIDYMLKLNKQLVHSAKKGTKELLKTTRMSIIHAV
jgi:hypothetical protein